LRRPAAPRLRASCMRASISAVVAGFPRPNGSAEGNVSQNSPARHPKQTRMKAAQWAT
jgi:hypothetical protein